MQKTTIGRLLIDQTLPDDMRGRNLTLGQEGLQALLQEVAEKYPDRYREITKGLQDVGADAAFTSGGYSFGLAHIATSPRARVIRDRVNKNVQQILADPSLSEKDKEDRIVHAAGSVTSEMEKALKEEGEQEDNPLMKLITSGAKGSIGNLRSLRGGDLLYVDYRDRSIPIPILRGYSEGLSPAEYFAGTYGARKGVIDLRSATQNAGYFGKLLTQATHRLIVTDIDDKEDRFPGRGLPVSTDDPGNEGALLARPAGPYPRNTVLTPVVLAKLRREGIEHLLVRSPLAGGAPDGGLYARDVGVRERGVLAPIGDSIGIAASQAISEISTQKSIGSKHAGGVAGATKGVSGFRRLEQLTSIPTVFPGGLTHADLDGRVGSIEEAPQGGNYVTVNDKRHYVSPGLKVLVKPGQDVEAGDPLSEGLPNPYEIVRHKGIGEGRRQWTRLFAEAAKGAGFSPHRRNLELIARGLINHVRLTDEVGDYSPDEVIPYSTVEADYRPRDGNQTVASGRAVGKYLEVPTLHHTIGTKIRASMLPELDRFGVKELTVHDEPPPFESEMIRAQDSLGADPDWMVRMLGANQEKHLLRGAHLGHVSDEAGTSYVPALAKGVGFGTYGKVKGWTLDDPPKSLMDKKEDSAYSGL